MFEKYMIVEEECKNIKENENTTGFQIGVRVTYYRGIIIGIIKDFQVTVDGKVYTKDNMEFTFNGNTYTFNKMYGVTEERWGFGDVALLTIKQEGGLSAGAHEVEVLEELRVSYGLMPEYHPNVARWKKTIIFEA